MTKIFLTAGILIAASCFLPATASANIGAAQCQVVNYFTGAKIANITMQKVGEVGHNPAILGFKDLTPHLAVRVFIMDNDMPIDDKYNPGTYGKYQGAVQMITVDSKGYIPDYAMFSVFGELIDSSSASSFASQPLDKFQVKCQVQPAAKK
jgi:hypothetical protein